MKLYTHSVPPHTYMHNISCATRVFSTSGRKLSKSSFCHILWWPWRSCVMPVAITYHSSGCPPSRQWWSSVIPVTVHHHSSDGPPSLQWQSSVIPVSVLCYSSPGPVGPPSLHASSRQLLRNQPSLTFPCRLTPPTYRWDGEFMDVIESKTSCIWMP